MTMAAPDMSVLRGRRVRIVHHALEVGGAEVQSLHLAEYLVRHDNDVEVWGFSDAGALARRCEELGIRWRLVPIAWAAGRANRTRDLMHLARVLRRDRPDIVLPYTDLPNMLCGAVSRLARVPLTVWQNRGVDTLSRSRLAKYVMARARCVICNSVHRRQYLVETLGVPAERVHVVRNGVAVPPPIRNRTEWRTMLGTEPHTFVAAMVANLTSFKDHTTLLRAWRGVLDRVTGHRPLLVLAGRYGDTTETLKALAFDLGLGDSVRFVGFLDDLGGLLSAIDAAVFSSRGEGLPNGVLEPMSVGLPVLATDNAGVREALGQGEDRQIVPSGDPTALADKIIWAMTRADEAAACGRANQVRAASTFSVRAMCENTSALLQACMNRSDTTIAPAAWEQRRAGACR
jgi:glycosyltransferase involved in cell wall biosynthesis